jgi:hypothetical protein
MRLFVVLVAFVLISQALAQSSGAVPRTWDTKALADWATPVGRTQRTTWAFHQ